MAESDKKPLVNMWVGLVGVPILLISMAISFVQCSEAHHANERADKEAADKHDATVRAETAERIAHAETAKAADAQEKLSAADQTASAEKQQAEALEKSSKADAQKAADALKAEQKPGCGPECGDLRRFLWDFTYLCWANPTCRRTRLVWCFFSSFLLSGRVKEPFQPLFLCSN